MTDYDSMSVDQLLHEYAEWARNHPGTHWEMRGIQGVVVDDVNPLNMVARKDAIFSALRKAVVREASVGTFDIKDDGYPLLDNPFPLILPKTSRGWDEYDLIPKEIL